MLSVKQGGIKYHFLSLWYDWIEPRSPGPMANTLTARPILNIKNIRLYFKKGKNASHIQKRWMQFTDTIISEHVKIDLKISFLVYLNRFYSTVRLTIWVQNDSTCAISLYDIVTANSLKSQNGTLFSHVWRRGRLAGSDTFQWPVIERDRLGGLRLMRWDKMKVPLCHYSDAPKESNLWTAWQLFPLDDD